MDKKYNVKLWEGEEPDEDDYLFEDAYWEDTGEPVLSRGLTEYEEQELAPDFSDMEYRKFNTLEQVGLIVLGYDIKQTELGSMDGDFSFLSDVTFAYNRGRMVSSFNIPLDIEDYATHALLETYNKSKVGPYIRYIPDGVDAVCFQVICGDVIRSYLWYETVIKEVKSSEPFRAKFDGSKLWVISQLSPEFTCDIEGIQISSIGWGSFRKEILDQSKNGIYFFFEDKLYSVYRNIFLHFRVESGMAYTKDRIPVFMTDLVENGYYDLGFESYLDLENATLGNFVVVGRTSKHENIYTRGRYHRPQREMTHAEYSKFRSGAVSFRSLYRLQFPPLQYDRCPDNKCIVLITIKTENFVLNYYDANRSFRDRLVCITYEHLKRLMKNCRIKNGYGYSRERPPDVMTPTVYAMSFAMKRRMVRYYATNEATGDTILISEPFSVTWFYDQLTRRGMYWCRGRFFNLNCALKMSYMGVKYREHRGLIITKELTPQVVTIYKGRFYIVSQGSYNRLSNKDFLEIKNHRDEWIVVRYNYRPNIYGRYCWEKDYVDDFLVREVEVIRGLRASVAHAITKYGDDVAVTLVRSVKYLDNYQDGVI